ncbi:hypothetical protein GOODEAATRI_022316, partial [Goodea atripinnis]
LRHRTVMDFIFSITGSGARVVRDAISQRLWPGHGQESVPVQLHGAGTAHEARHTLHHKTVVSSDQSPFPSTCKHATSSTVTPIKRRLPGSLSSVTRPSPLCFEDACRVALGAFQGELWELWTGRDHLFSALRTVTRV